MYEVVSLCVDAGPKSLHPLIDGLINDALVCPKCDHTSTLFQLIGVAYGHLIHAALRQLKFCRPNLLGVLGRQRSGEINSGVA